MKRKLSQRKKTSVSSKVLRSPEKLAEEFSWKEKLITQMSDSFQMKWNFPAYKEERELRRWGFSRLRDFRIKDKMTQAEHS